MKKNLVLAVSIVIVSSSCFVLSFADSEKDKRGSKEELKNLGQEMSTLMHVYNQDRKELNEELKELRESWKESVKDATYESVYKKTYQADHLSDLRNFRDELKMLQKGRKEAKLDLIRKIVKARKAGDNHQIPVFLGNSEVTFTDSEPIIKNGRTLVPVRNVLEGIGADVKWDAATATVTLTKENVEVKLVLNSKEILVNGKKSQLEEAAQIHKNRTVLPIRAVMEAFSKKVDWDAASGSVIIED